MMTAKIYTSLPGIRPRRLALGMKAAHLAEEIGVTKQAWFYWENGDTMPSAGYLPALAELLQCSIEDLYRDTEGTDGETDCHGQCCSQPSFECRAARQDARNDGKEADADADDAG